jgi:hypothetical protein
MPGILPVPVGDNGVDITSGRSAATNNLAERHTYYLLMNETKCDDISIPACRIT